MKRHILSAILALSFVASPVAAAPFELAQAPSITIGPGGVTVRPDDRDRRDRDRMRESDRDRDRARDRDRDRSDRDRGRDRDRYICVVPQPQSSDRRRPNVCSASPGRIGETCRCAGTVGSGRLELDR